MKNLIFLMAVLITMTSCQKGNNFLGKWTKAGEPGYLEISRTGDVFKITVFAGGTNQTEIAPLTLKDDILTYDPGNGFPIRKIFIESNGNLNVDGTQLTKMSSNKPAKYSEPVNRPATSSEPVNQNANASTQQSDTSITITGGE